MSTSLICPFGNSIHNEILPLCGLQREHQRDQLAFPFILESVPAILSLLHIRETFPATEGKLVQEIDGETLCNERVQNIAKAVIPAVFGLVLKFDGRIGIRILCLELKWL